MSSADRSRKVAIESSLVGRVIMSTRFCRDPSWGLPCPWVSMLGPGCPGRSPTPRASSVFLLGLAWMLGCSDSSTTAPPDDYDDTPVEALAVSPGGASLSGAGSTFQFTAEGTSGGGESVSNPLVTWSSLNPGVASIDPATGLVTAVANGQATVMAQGIGARAFALVTISTPELGPVADWQFDNEPRPSIQAVWGSGDSDVFAVGNSGTIYHFDGQSWTEQSTSVDYDLLDIWGFSAGDVYAAGRGGTILHFEGGIWSEVESGTSEDLSGVWGSSPDDIFVVGERGGILHFDGTNWIPMDSGVNCRFSDVRGSSSTDVFVVGCSGTVLHFDGTEWSGDSRAIDAGRLDELWVNGPDDVYLVGWGAWHFDGTDWTDLESPYGYLRAIWGAPSGALFAVGSGGTILKYDDSAWTQMETGTTQILDGVWGTSEDDVFAVGVGNTILHYDGTLWSTVRTGLSVDFKGVWGVSADEVYAVPYGMPFYHFDGSGWTAMEDPLFTSYVADVWGTCSSDLFVIGGNAPRWVLHYDGSAWAVAPSLDYNQAKSLWGASPMDVFSAGGWASQTEGGLIHRYDGEGWSRIHTVGDRGLEDIWGTSASSAFAVGEGGTIVRFDGSGWTQMASGTDELLRAVWGTSPNSVFAVGGEGTILRFDGSSWTSMSSGTLEHLRAVGGTSPTDVYAGGGDLLLHFDGQAWTSVAEALMDTSGVGISGIWVDPDGTVIVVGNYGMILRGTR